MEFILKFTEDKYIDSLLKGSLHFGTPTTFHPNNSGEVANLGPNIVDQEEGTSTINYNPQDIDVFLSNAQIKKPVIVKELSKLQEKISFSDKNVGTVSMTILNSDNDFEKDSDSNLIVKESVIRELVKEFPNRPLVIEPFSEFINYFRSTLKLVENDTSVVWMRAARIDYKKENQFDPLLEVSKRDYVQKAYFEKPVTYCNQREFRIAAEFVDQIDCHGRNFEFKDLFAKSEVLPNAESLRAIKILMQ